MPFAIPSFNDCCLQIFFPSSFPPYRAQHSKGWLFYPVEPFSFWRQRIGTTTTTTTAAAVLMQLLRIMGYAQNAKSQQGRNLNRTAIVPGDARQEWRSTTTRRQVRWRQVGAAPFKFGPMNCACLVELRVNEWVNVCDHRTWESIHSEWCDRSMRSYLLRILTQMGNCHLMSSSCSSVSRELRVQCVPMNLLDKNDNVIKVVCV